MTQNTDAPASERAIQQVFLPEMQHRRTRGIVYGPVHSRRLGYSLGLNVLPWGGKYCPFDCVYCEVGSDAPCEQTAESGGFPAPATVLEAVEDTLRGLEGLDAITFSGAGEPTLHPQFDELVDGVARLRDQYCPAAQVIVLSNGALAHRPRVGAGLDRADMRLMKLDAGDEATFRAVNRPAPSLHIEQIIENLRQLDDIIIQTLLLDGVISNVHPPALAAYREALRTIRPLSVQLYSISRAVPVTGIQAVPHYLLESIARDIMAETGIPVSVY